MSGLFIGGLGTHLNCRCESLADCVHAVDDVLAGVGLGSILLHYHVSDPSTAEALSNRLEDIGGPMLSVHFGSGHCTASVWYGAGMAGAKDTGLHARFDTQPPPILP